MDSPAKAGGLFLSCLSHERVQPASNLSAYDRLMNAKHILERVSTLKHEMQDLRIANARLDEPRHSKGSYEARLTRLEQIRMELATLPDQFTRTETRR
jgi:hypothetical protein